MEKVPLLLAAEPHHEQPKSLDAKRYPSTKSVHCFEWYAISKTEVAIREGIIMEKTSIGNIGDDHSNQRRNHHPDLRTGRRHEIQSGSI